jgi:broad specificity phosphatase PhoE
VLYLVRHGRTAQNAGRRLLGRLDVPLDDLGRQQAEALGRVPFLRDAARVVASPLGRALETADRLGPPVVIDERWIEIDYGVFDGMRLEEAPELWKQWSADLSYVPDGGESIAAMAARVRKACDELWEEAAVEDIVVVSHVSPIKAAVAWAIGAGDETAWRMFIDVASVSVIGPGRPSGGRSLPSLRSFNETHFRPSN